MNPTTPALAGLLILAVQGDPEWNTFHGGPSLDGVAAGTIPDSPVRLWEFKTGAPVEAPPVYGGGRFYAVTAGSGLFALDTEGRPVWTFRIEGDSFLSPALYADGTIFAGTEKGLLVALDGGNGQERWRAKVGDTVMGTPNRIDLPGGRHAIAAMSQNDGVLRAFDPGTGRALWAAEGVGRCDAHPSASGGRIVVGSCAAALHLFEAAGEVRRRDIPLAEDGQVAGGAALAGGIAYVGTHGGKVFAVDLEAGKILWRNRSAGGETFTTPAVSDRLVVFGSKDGKVYAVDRAKGDPVWEHDTGGEPSSPVVVGERVTVSSKGTLLVLELATGKKVWSAPVSDAISGPAVARGLLVVGTDQGTVVAWGAAPRERRGR